MRYTVKHNISPKSYSAFGGDTKKCNGYTTEVNIIMSENIRKKYIEDYLKEILCTLLKSGPLDFVRDNELRIHSSRHSMVKR